MEPKTGKRIVSRGRYIKLMGMRLSLLSCGAVCMLVGGVAAMLGVMEGVDDVIRGSVGTGFSLPSPNGFYVACLVCFLVGVCCTFLGEKVKEDITPLTRANTADLPAPESLVRASSEPLRVQEAVLLRAAEGQETPSEELVRASGEGRSEQEACRNK